MGIISRKQLKRDMVSKGLRVSPKAVNVLAEALDKFVAEVCARAVNEAHRQRRVTIRDVDIREVLK